MDQNLTLREYIDTQVEAIRREFTEIRNYRDSKISELRERYETERDRRYSEVNVEKEKALKIKEEADKAALGLAREIQTYKDEKANELREQINSERGLYASKADLGAAMEKVAAQLKPIAEYVSAERGKSGGVSTIGTAAVAVISILIALGSLIFAYIRSP